MKIKTNKQIKKHTHINIFNQTNKITPNSECKYKHMSLFFVYLWIFHFWWELKVTSKRAKCRVPLFTWNISLTKLLILVLLNNRDSHRQRDLWVWCPLCWTFSWCCDVAYTLGRRKVPSTFFWRNSQYFD